MGEKDLSEKLLENCNDVFADIVNGLIFHGRQEVNPDDLENTSLESMYRSLGDGKIRSQERDVAKIWKKEGVKIALCGLENQTKADKYMPFRIMGYEGASYRDMLFHGKAHLSPVVSMVLYFGERRWTLPRSAKEILSGRPYAKELAPFLNDAKANICEVSFLTEEELSCFHSDFRAVADFFVNKRKNPDYVPQDRKTLKHVEEVLCLLSAATGDKRYRDICLEENFAEVSSMCDVAERLERQGEAIGLNKGALGMLYDLVASGKLTIAEAAEAGKKLGVQGEGDFLKKALLAGYDLKKAK